MRPPAALVGACLVVLGVSCFSERGGTGPVAGQECRVPVGSQVPGSVLVFVRDFSFTPATVTVPAGGTVTWVNCDPPGEESHTSTADAGGWSSPLLGSGQAFSRTFGQAGDFAYHCEPHPFMTGTVTVE
jgi:plastocyanin